MKMILLTSEDCSICKEAEEKFKKEFVREMIDNEAEIVNLDTDEEAQELWIENELPLAPIVVLVTGKNKVISHIKTEDLLEGVKEASTAAKAADQAAVESSG